VTHSTTDTSMTDFINDTPGTEIDTRKPWITPEIKELADAQDAQGGARLGPRESVFTPYAISYRPS